MRRRLDNAEAARQREAEAREQAAAKIRCLTLMITHQPKPEAEAQPVPTPEPEPQARPEANQRRKGYSRREWVLIVLFWLALFAALAWGIRYRTHEVLSGRSGARVSSGTGTGFERHWHGFRAALARVSSGTGTGFERHWHEKKVVFSFKNQ